MLFFRNKESRLHRATIIFTHVPNRRAFLLEKFRIRSRCPYNMGPMNRIQFLCFFLPIAQNLDHIYSKLNWLQLNVLWQICSNNVDSSHKQQDTTHHRQKQNEMKTKQRNYNINVLKTYVNLFVIFIEVTMLKARNFYSFLLALLKEKTTHTKKSNLIDHL